MPPPALPARDFPPPDPRVAVLLPPCASCAQSEPPSGDTPTPFLSQPQSLGWNLQDRPQLGLPPYGLGPLTLGTQKDGWQVLGFESDEGVGALGAALPTQQAGPAAPGEGMRRPLQPAGRSWTRHAGCPCLGPGQHCRAQPA